MAGKIMPSFYTCKCGFEQSGHELMFCGKCGKTFNNIDGVGIHAYVNTCKCCIEINESCEKCNSYPTPMTKEQVKVHTDKLEKEVKDLKTRQGGIRMALASLEHKVNKLSLLSDIEDTYQAYQQPIQPPLNPHMYRRPENQGGAFTPEVMGTLNRRSQQQRQDQQGLG